MFQLMIVLIAMRGPKLPPGRLRKLPGRQALAVTAAVLLVLAVALFSLISRSSGLLRFRQRAVQAFKCYAEVRTAAATAACILVGECCPCLQTLPEHVLLRFNVQVGYLCTSLRPVIDAGFQGDVAAMRHIIKERLAAEQQGGKGGQQGGQRPTRGIVLAAGGGAYAANAFVNLWVLRRHLNCTLPAVIM